VLSPFVRSFVCSLFVHRSFVCAFVRWSSVVVLLLRSFVRCRRLLVVASFVDCCFVRCLLLLRLVVCLRLSFAFVHRLSSSVFVGRWSLVVSWSSLFLSLVASTSSLAACRFDVRRRRRWCLFRCLPLRCSFLDVASCVRALLFLITVLIRRCLHCSLPAAFFVVVVVVFVVTDKRTNNQSCPILPGQGQEGFLRSCR